MSEDRDKRIKQSDEELQESADVEAHKKAGRFGNDEGSDEGSDDVEAHVRQGKV